MKLSKNKPFLALKTPHHQVEALLYVARLNVMQPRLTCIFISKTMLQMELSHEASISNPDMSVQDAGNGVTPLFVYRIEFDISYSKKGNIAFLIRAGDTPLESCTIFLSWDANGKIYGFDRKPIALPSPVQLQDTKIQLLTFSALLYQDNLKI